jgi:hypothetical protein
MATIDFFLSFNRADRVTADLVYKMVTGAGYSCFYQHADIPEGANFVQRMTSGLGQAATMLALFSLNYFQSKFALIELQAAFADDPLNERDFILPILLKEVAIPRNPSTFCRTLIAERLARPRFQTRSSPPWDDDARATNPQPIQKSLKPIRPPLRKNFSMILSWLTRFFNRNVPCAIGWSMPFVSATPS